MTAPNTPALPPHPEPHSHTWTEQEKRCILAWGAAMQAEIQALRADARRYRWLRIEGACEQVCNETWKDLLHAEQLDAAIDAAVSATGEGGQS